MLFSSQTFLTLLLPATLLLHLLAPRSWRNAVLLVCSLAFYALGSGWLVALLLISIAADHVAAGWVIRGREPGREGWRRAGVALSLGVNLGLLAVFKYATFAVGELNRVGQLLGMTPLALPAIALPAGISFYSFQSMSYTLDLARGRLERRARFTDLACYVAMFPQLIAGPIVRYGQLAPALADRRLGLTQAASGAIRFLHGLVKKVLIADPAGAVAKLAFGGQLELSAPAAWLGLVAFAVQIYFDFSAYSDMAIGLGRLLGFELPENFRRPYAARSVTEFWRRWHITLSTWFRDYLYIPLGGSRGGTRETLVNLAVVFLLVGIWHGARWTFLGFGAIHGLAMIAERLAGQRALEGEVRWVALRRLWTLLVVGAAWVMFASPSGVAALAYYRDLVGGGGGGLQPFLAPELRLGLIATTLGALSVALPRECVWGEQLTDNPGAVWMLGRALLVFVWAPLALGRLATGGFQPFLYWQF